MDLAFGSVHKLAKKERDQYFPNTDLTLGRFIGFPDKSLIYDLFQNIFVKKYIENDDTHHL